jgi:hypothetical protein
MLIPEEQACLELIHDYFLHILSNSLSINHPISRRSAVWVTDSVVQWTTPTPLLYVVLGLGLCCVGTMAWYAIQGILSDI